mmetsp:Transcript_28665/g.52198  ORF Transcript_28665/g.52198 Transcript_28665/m.52198 type:complete len:85 (-) Transcript_28665:729-983(-)
MVSRLIPMVGMTRAHNKWQELHFLAMSLPNMRMARIPLMSHATLAEVPALDTQYVASPLALVYLSIKESSQATRTTMKEVAKAS